MLTSSGLALILSFFLYLSWDGLVKNGCHTFSNAVTLKKIFKRKSLILDVMNS